MTTDTSAADVVRGLLEEELESIASEVAQGRTGHILKVLDQRGAAELLIREQYSGRYPFELLQNANDACASRNRAEGRATLGVRVVLSDVALMVADQGIGFGPDEVRAITGFARSSKDPRKSIGYKGLGFKSVGEICERPQVASTDVLFGFDPERVRQRVQTIAGTLPPDQRLPVYPFPFLLAAEDFGSDRRLLDDLLAEGYRTVLRLPFKPGVSRGQVAGHLKDLILPRLLVFLDGTGELEVSGTDADFRVVAVRQPSGEFEQVLLEVNGTEEHWLLCRKRVPVPFELLEPLGGAWRLVEESGVAAAIPLDDQGQVNTIAETEPLHVYFPTEEKTNLLIILHGDFPLDPDRRFVARSSEAGPYRDWLAARLGQLMGDVAPALAERWPGDGRLVRILAPRTDQDGFGRQCVDEIMASLETARFIPCVDGRIRLPGEALRLPQYMPDPRSAHRYLDTMALGRLVVADAEVTPASRALLDRLRVEALAEEDVLAHLRVPEPDGVDEVVAFYEWLVEWSQQGGRDLTSKLGEARVVRTSDGRWLGPAEEAIFFPRERGSPELIAELPIAIADVPEVEGVRWVLEEAGVRPFRWRELLVESVLPVLTDPDADEPSRRKAMAILERYYITEGGGDQEVSSRAGGVLLEASTADGSKRRLRRADELYFGQAWLGHDRLERLYGPFGESEFLVEAPSNDDVEERQAFLEWLGVVGFPRILSAETTERDRYLIGAISRHPHARLIPNFRQWFDSEEIRHASQCPQGHPESQQLRASYALDRFPEVVAAGDVPRMRALFEELALHWGPVYEGRLHAVFYCKNTTHQGERRRRASSLLAFALRTEAWVPAVVGNEEVMAPPSEVWRLPPDVPARVAPFLQVLADDLNTPRAVGMCSALGVVDGARPSPSHLAETLRRLAHLHASATPPDHLPAMARWVLTRFDEALIRHPVPREQLGPVPLLAVHGDERLFVEDPYVVDDPLLTETWRDAVPILDADRELRAVPAILGLPNLADEVKVSPQPVEPLPRKTEQLERDLAEAAPFLAAVAVQQAPTRADQIFARLPRVRVVACRELVMQQGLGDVEKHAQAEAFIETRIVGTGRGRHAVGTAFLQVGGDGTPPWYALGPRLAEFLDVTSQRDAFALLLAANDVERYAYLQSRQLGDEDIKDAAARLTPREDWAEELGVDPVPTSDPRREEPDGTPPSSGAGSGAEREDTTRPQSSGEEQPMGEHPSKDEEPLPRLQVDRVVVAQAERSPVEPPPARTPGSHEKDRRQGGELIDWDRLMRTSRTYGQRGEQLVFLKEQERLEEFGFDREAVDWVSQQRETESYDIRSLDEAGQVIYIEVKATSSTDPHEPFEVSTDQLDFAIANRDRYFVYRVLDVTSATPTVLIYDDPIGRILEGHGQIRVSRARLYLSP